MIGTAVRAARPRPVEFPPNIPYFSMSALPTNLFIERYCDLRHCSGCNAALIWCGSGARRFLEVVERWIEKPPSAAAQRRDWTKHKLRLALWQREVEKARARYLVERNMCVPEHPGGLRWLYDRWRAIIPDDAAEQVRLACERYHEFQCLLSE